jgi:hypothetical protein
MSIQVQDLSQMVRRAQLVEKAKKVMLSLKNFLVILETKEVFQTIPLPLCLLQNINVSQEMVMSQDWCNPVLQREIQSRFLLTTESGFDRNYTAMRTHVRWSVHLSALLIT